MNDIDNFIKENGLKVVAPKLSTTFSVTQAMVPSMDIEILIPLDNQFNDTDKYKCKNEFKLTNCLQISHKGNPMTFQNTIMNLQKYIEDNKLMPISSLYTVNIKEAKTKEEMENFLELNNEQMLDIDGGSFIAVLGGAWVLYELGYAVGTAIAHITK